MKLTNKQMDEYYYSLYNLSEKATGRLGYAIARNLRKLSEELVEYQSLKDKAIEKYGEKGEDGIFRIKIGSEEYSKYLKEMKEYMEIQHDVPIFHVKSLDVMSSELNAKEMLAVDFMIGKESDDE